MDFEYFPRGVCSQRINFSIEDGRLHNVRYTGGCNGNTKGLGALLEGMEAKEAMERLRGIRCGMKSSSCPDQLAKALEEALKKI